MNILLVDDDEDQRRTLRSSFMQRGHTVRAVSDGIRALLYLDDEVDVVISDIQMPGLDGVELLGTIRERYPDLPVILMTGHGTLDTAVAALRNRAFDYLSKPVALDELLASVDRIKNNRKATE
ncbi:MAG: response regulator [bacterium]|nr:response regulator [bacterium]